ncbi:hypothetical protein CASFOL_042298 [Castilleja foliolosa]|uniref:RING-type E3 ubiquitin transferase n=1 Tax=Castilleja foliolosa TaxID=1961234 RepID=A0ABD3BAQ8_9LAMI
MQRERSAVDSFLEPIDLNQGSIPNNTPMDQSSSWDNISSPVENRLSSYMLSSTDTNGTTDTCQNFSGWDRGESSSGPNNTQDRADTKTGLGWSFFNSCSGPEVANSNNCSFDPPPSTGISSNEPPSVQNYSSARSTLNLNSNNGQMREQIPTFYASASNIGAFTGSSSNSGENNDTSGPGSPFATWGTSCKRKALEGNSGQFYPPSGSSSSSQTHLHIPGCSVTRGNLTISSGPHHDSYPANYSEHLINPSNSRAGMSRRTPGFSLYSGGLSSESPATNFTPRSNHLRPEPVLFDNNRRGTSSRNTGFYSSELRSPMTTNTNRPLNQTLHPTHVNEAIGAIHANPWIGSLNPPRERGPPAREEPPNVRNYRRNNIVSGPETRNVPQDQIDWSFVPPPGNSLPSSRTHSSSGSRVGPGSSALQHYQNIPNQGATWASFNRAEATESGVRRSHFVNLLSSSEEAGPSSSRGHRQLDQRSAAFLMEMPGEDVTGPRSLAAVESRHRLIRQVLSAMRRGVHLQAEDYMFVDPFMSGFAELHDRHRDMRLDVDNMSYEELLALEDRIGNVSTGLSEERIRGSLKNRKFESLFVLPNLEPCCVCQENYMNGDDIGTLDCGHEFHTGCIKQWLTHKNICPICKTTALKT